MTRTTPAVLAAMVRAALQIGEPELAEPLVGGLEPRYPYAEHALVAAVAALTEARGDLPTAADAYADAAGRWERFGVVPEQAFVLLRRGRCLLGLSRTTEAAAVLQHAREVFERLKAVPALSETEGLAASDVAQLVDEDTVERCRVSLPKPASMHNTCITSQRHSEVLSGTPG